MELVFFSQDTLQHCHQMAMSYNYTCFEHRVEKIHTYRGREKALKIWLRSARLGSLCLYLFISVNTRSLYSGNVKRSIISWTWLPNWALIDMKSVARAEALRSNTCWASGRGLTANQSHWHGWWGAIKMAASNQLLSEVWFTSRTQVF